MDLTPFHGPPASAPRIPGFAARTLLGFGAHGEVWQAEDLSTGTAVAVKIGRRGTSRTVDPDRETALLCRIQHPHVVRLQRVVRLEDEGLALILDLAAGGSLASLIAARGPIDPGEVSTLLVPLAGALGHLHDRGIVHGDISPGNVLFTGEGRPQLGDLGVARVLGVRGDETWSTPGFTDPASVGRPPGRLDPRAADRWGLAAVGWFALTGRPPGAGEPVQTGLPAEDPPGTFGSAAPVSDLGSGCPPRPGGAGRASLAGGSGRRRSGWRTRRPWSATPPAAAQRPGDPPEPDC